MAVGDYEINPDVNRWTEDGKWLPTPPPGHPRRCQANNRFREQCGEWALRGVPYCKRHGGRGMQRGVLNTVRTPDGSIMKNKYGRQTLGKLKDLLETISESEADKIDLADEIDVVRVLSSQSVAILSSLSALRERDPKNGPSEATLLHAMSYVQTCMQKVATIAEKQAKIQALSREDTFDKDQVRYILTRVVAVLQRCVLPLDKEVYEDVCERISAIQPPEKLGVQVMIT